MRKLGMAGVIAAALLAQAAYADDASKERKEAYDATRAETKQEAGEAKQETREAWDKTKEETREAKTDAQREMKERDARRESMGSGSTGMAETRTAQPEKKHPLFDGKNNFDLEGKIQKVSKSSITVSREELPAATLNVSKDTKIELDGEQVSMKQLKQGQEVKASFNLKGDKAEAVEIKAEKLDTQK